MRSGLWQMAIYSTLVGLIGMGSFVYILLTKPAYLHATRNGVPYFTPHVINPTGGEPLDVNDLVRNFKGQDK